VLAPDVLHGGNHSPGHERPPPPHLRYKLTVSTLDSRGAGTSAAVSVRLMGEKGCSDELLLERSADSFSRGKVRPGGRGRAGRRSRPATHYARPFAHPNDQLKSYTRVYGCLNMRVQYPTER
jgi:hypothetical protein